MDRHEHVYNIIVQSSLNALLACIINLHISAMTLLNLHFTKNEGVKRLNVTSVTINPTEERLYESKNPHE